MPFEQPGGLENPLGVEDHLADDALETADQIIEGRLRLTGHATAGPNPPGQVAIPVHGTDAVAQGLQGPDEINPERQRRDSTDEHAARTAQAKDSGRQRLACDDRGGQRGEGRNQSEGKGEKLGRHAPTDPCCS